MKRVKKAVRHGVSCATQVNVRQSLLVAGFVMVSASTQASVTISTGSGVVDRIADAGSLSIRNPDITINGSAGVITLQNPGRVILPPATYLNTPSASSSVSGSMNYSVGMSSGNFSESDSSQNGSAVELDLSRKGFAYHAEASAQTGLAKAHVETKRAASGSGFGNSYASATSNWSDSFVISGGTGLGTANFASILDGVLASGKNGSAGFSLNIGYAPHTSCYSWYNSCGEADNSQTLVSQNSNLSGKGKSELGQALEGEFTFAYNKPFTLTATLNVNASNGGMADFTLESLGDSLVLPAGANVLSASRLFSVQAVPEAETYAMMLAGLGLVGWATMRRRTTNK